jgi:hypothetical protein
LSSLFEKVDAFADRGDGTFEVLEGEGLVCFWGGLLGEFEGEREFIVGF